MERHPAGCDPSSFRSLPTPSRVPPPSTTNHSNRPSLVTSTNDPPSKYQDLLNIPGIKSALSTLQAVASDVVQPVTRYNRYTYLNRFNTAALRLADAFIDHIHQIRRQEIRAYKRTAPNLSDTHLGSTYIKQIKTQSDDDFEDDEFISRKRSTRLARKRPRPRVYVSSDEDEYINVPHRKTLPRRSKEIRTNLNDDLAYVLMARRSPSPERPQQLKRIKRESSVDDIEYSDDDSSSDDANLFRVVRPLPYVRRRPLASDNSSLTPFIEDDDDSTDTEMQRREHARRSLKTVIYGPGKAEFTEKELLTVFPARSKRRMIADAIVRTSLCSRVDHRTMPYNRPSQLMIANLCRIPKEIIARYISGTHWLSPTPPDVRDIDVFPGTSGFVPGENAILAKQRFPSSDRETRDGDSGKASSATYVNSGSSTTGSPRAKKLEVQNEAMNIELGPSLSSLKDTRVEEANGGRASEATHQKNGKIPELQNLAFKAWKDFAPYGREPRWRMLPAQATEVQNMKPANGQGATGEAGSNVPLLQNVAPVRQEKQPTPEKRLNQDKILQTSSKQLQPANTNPQLKNPVQKSAARTMQAKAKPSPPQQNRQVQHTPQTVQLVPRSNSQPTMAPSPNQMALITRGSPAMPPVGMHPQMSVQPQLSLQPQPAILTAFPVQIAHQTGFQAHQALHLQQYGQDPRMFSQWQLQNAPIQQTPGALQLSPGYVSVNNVAPATASGPFPLQNGIVSVQPALPMANDASTSTPAGTTIRPDVAGIQANGVTIPDTADTAQPSTSRSSPTTASRPGNFNSQLQEQYHKHYEEMYSKHYEEHMKTLKKQRVEHGAS